MTIRTGFGDQPASPVIDRQTCTNCFTCVNICSTETLVIIDGKAELDTNPAIGCMGCGHCMMVCPTDSIKVSGRNLSPDDLILLQPREKRATLEQLEALMLARRSMRRFSNREVKQETVEQIITAASTAPMGFPPSDVNILVMSRDRIKELKKDLTQYFKITLKGLAPLLWLLRPFFGKVLYEQMKSFILPAVRMDIAHQEQGKDILFYDPPCLLIFHASPYADPADCTIACTYAMLAAEALGLGTIMLGLAPNFMARNKKLRRKYGIPLKDRLTIMLAVGYPAVDYRRTVRRRFAAVRYL